MVKASASGAVDVGFSGVSRNFKGGRDIISTFFKCIFFRSNKVEADRETKKALEGSEGMIPRTFFENSLAVMAILVLFE